MKRFSKLRLLVIATSLTALLIVAFVLVYPRLPFTIFVGNNNSTIVKSFSIDQNHYSSRFSKDRYDSNLPPLVILSFVDSKQPNSLNIRIGELNFDGLITTGYSVFPFRLAALVRINIDQETYNNYKEYDLSYLVSLAFEHSVRASIVGQQKIDFLSNKKLYEEINLGILNYYREKSRYPVKLEILKI